MVMVIGDSDDEVGIDDDNDLLNLKKEFYWFFWYRLKNAGSTVWKMRLWGWSSTCIRWTINSLNQSSRNFSCPISLKPGRLVDDVAVVVDDIAVLVDDNDDDGDI